MVVAGIGGLVVGHILWLIAISLAISTTAVEQMGADRVGRHRLSERGRRPAGLASVSQKSSGWAAFLLCLPISPVLLTLTVLGVTYL